MVEMKKALLLLIVAVFLLIPLAYAENYGAGAYGSGVYNVGETSEDDDDNGNGGGGGGGGAAVVTTDETTKVWQLMAAGSDQIMKVTKTAIGIKQISITVKNQAINAEITVRKLSEQPATITKTVTGKTYKFIEITKKNLEDTDLTRVGIEFQVEKTWIESNNIDENTVKLYRYSGTNWVALSTKKTESDDTYVYYNATSTGLSVFAIAGEEKVEEVIEEEEEVIEEEEEVPVEEEIPVVEEELPPAEVAPPSKTKIVIGAVLVILAILIAILLFLYNKNPKFRASVNNLKERFK